MREREKERWLRATEVIDSVAYRFTCDVRRKLISVGPVAFVRADSADSNFSLYIYIQQRTLSSSSSSRILECIVQVWNIIENTSCLHWRNADRWLAADEPPICVYIHIYMNELRIKTQTAITFHNTHTRSSINVRLVVNKRDVENTTNSFKLVHMVYYYILIYT